MRKIQNKQGATWTEAKHEYFENQAKYDGKSEKVETISSDKATEIVKAVEATEEFQKTEKKLRKGLSIAETKLGITMILTKFDCAILGIDLAMTTSTAIKDIRKRLGLSEKPQRD